MTPLLIEVLPEWRTGRGRWWCPNSAGYTDTLSRAGVYDPDSPAVRAGLDKGTARPIDEVIGDVLADDAWLHAHPLGFTEPPETGSVGALLHVELRAVVWRALQGLHGAIDAALQRAKASGMLPADTPFVHPIAAAQVELADIVAAVGGELVAEEGAARRVVRQRFTVLRRALAEARAALATGVDAGG